MVPCAPVVYLYDGSLDGMLCCIFDAFARREDPQEILCLEEEQPTLFALHEVTTDPLHARRVLAGVQKRLGATAADWLLDAYHSDLAGRELQALAFVRLGFSVGEGVCRHLAEAPVAALFAASRALHSEAHLLKGFIRFADCGGTLVARIRPKNRVLPYLARHFCARYPHECILIHDETHRQALAIAGGRWRLAPLDELLPCAPSAAEERLVQLWRQFYDTVEIEQRHDERGRMTHLPRRYWECMQEMRPLCRPLPPSVRQALAEGSLRLPDAPLAPVLTPTHASMARRVPLADGAAPCPGAQSLPPRAQKSGAAPK